MREKFTESIHKNNPSIKKKSIDFDKMIDLIDNRLTQYPWITGDVVGIMDVSLYGMTFIFRKPPASKGYNYILHKSEKFSAWFEKMDAVVKERLEGPFVNTP